MESGPSPADDRSRPGDLTALEARVARLEALIDQVMTALDDRAPRARRHPLTAIHELRRRAKEIDDEYARLVENIRKPH
jgi:hypothetical protein